MTPPEAWKKIARAASVAAAMAHGDFVGGDIHVVSADAESRGFDDGYVTGGGERHEDARLHAADGSRPAAGSNAASAPERPTATFPRRLRART